jgi:hypothetical protein
MNEHKNIITIEDEIKEFSDKPVKSSALYKKVKELESNAVPDASEANVGDVLTKGEDGIGWAAPSGGGGEWTPDYTLNITETQSGLKITETLAQIQSYGVDRGKKVAINAGGQFWMAFTIASWSLNSSQVLTSITFVTDLSYYPKFTYIENGTPKIAYWTDNNQTSLLKPVKLVYNGSTVGYTEYNEAIVYTFS